MSSLTKQYETVLIECKTILEKTIKCHQNNDTSGARHWYRELKYLSGLWLNRITELQLCLFLHGYTDKLQASSKYVSLFHRILTSAESRLNILEAIES